MMITTNNVWFSPINVLYHFARLDNVVTPEYKKTKDYKKAYEANLVAIMLIGIIKLQKQQYWMQLVKDDEGTPDIRTFRYAKKNDILNWQEVQEVEVVHYEKHSSESITDFLKRTKFSFKKSYPETTIILCFVDKTTKLGSLEQLAQEMQAVKQKNPVIILGNTHPNKTIYLICQVHPEIDLLTEFDAMEEAKNKKYIGVLKVRFDPKGEPIFIHDPNEKHYPFEVLGIKKLR